jgi:hypothetical protein
LSKPTTPLIDEIDVDNWAIDGIEESKDFQTNTPSFNAKQAHILEKKQDLNIVCRSLLIEYGIMEISLCCMISVQVVRRTFTNDILKLRRDFYYSYHLGDAIFMFLLKGVMGAWLISPQRGQIIGMIIGKLLMMSLKNSCNPNLPCIIKWEKCFMCGMETTCF